MGKTTIKKDLSNVYSTDEIVVGTWIDGKPIYRKILSVVRTGSSDFEFGHIADVERVLKAELCLIGNNGNNQEATYPYYYFVRAFKSTSSYSFQTVVTPGAKEYALSGTQYLIVEYTKTTD